jgi:two-component system OmpR family response regulator
MVLDRLSHTLTGQARFRSTARVPPARVPDEACRQVVTRTMLLENVWDYHFDPQTNVIDVHISRLRGKIDKGFGEPLLHTVRGAGYMIRDSAR